jgi:hypothetical protein
MQAIVFVPLFSGLLTIQIYPQTHFTNDFSSFLVITESLTSSGSLYSSFFDIKPPGLYLLLALIQVLVGTSYAAWVLIHFFLSLVLSLLILGFVKTLFDRRVQNAVLGIALATQTISISYTANFLSADFIGLIFALSGLYGLMRLRETVYLPIFIALLIFAGTIKEVYIFLPFVILAFLKSWSLSKVFLTLLFCTLFVYIPILLILVKLGEFQSYLEIFNFKSDQFSFASIQEFILRALRIGFEIVTVPSVALLLSLLIVLFLKWWNTSSQVTVFGLDANLKLLVLFVTFVYFGLVWQGKAVKGHTLIAIYVPLILLLLLLIFKLNNLSQNRENGEFKAFLLIAVIGISLLGTTNSQFLELRKLKPIEYGKSILDEKGADKYRIPGKGCLLSVYGWDAGAYYHYSKRDPCTRFFLSPLVDKSPMLWKLYQDEILTNPPSTILYSTNGADMNITIFERNVVNWRKVLAECYRENQDNVFVPKFENRYPQLLKSCLKMFS